MFKKLILLGVCAAPFFFSAQETESLPTSASTSRILLMPSVGYAWRLAKMPSGISGEARNYLKGLKNGMDIGLGAYYMVKGNAAIGLRASAYFASSEGRLTVSDGNGSSVSGFVDTTDNITYIGPAFMFSNFNEDTRHKFFYDISLGVITYTTKTGNVKGTGSNLGAELNFAYQYELTKNIYLGPKLGLNGGSLSKMKFNGTTVNFGDEEKEGLTRLSLSAAATFRF